MRPRRFLRRFSRTIQRTSGSPLPSSRSKSGLPSSEGEQLETKDEKDKQYRLHERLEKTFERRFALPLDVDTTSIGAEFTKGVLTVSAPRVEVPKPRKVAIAAKR
jgi:hypothetical protein